MKGVTKRTIIEIINTNMENGTVTLEQYDSDLTEFGIDSIRFIQTMVSISKNSNEKHRIRIGFYPRSIQSIKYPQYQYQSSKIQADKVANKVERVTDTS